MEVVSQRLDEITLEFFENLERLQEKRASLCAALKDGHLNLSKARYSMGNKSVGALQYDHKMYSALYHVAVENMEPVEELDISYATFHLMKNLPGEVLTKLDSTNHQKGEEETFLRKRKSQKLDGSQDVNEELPAMEELYVSNKTSSPSNKQSYRRAEENKIQDPIKWFGILVPVCLKTAQKNFQSAIELSCELVNLENKQKRIIQDFGNLMRQKKALITESTNKCI